MITTLCFFASFRNAAVLAPGIVSASRKYLWSALWQKYCERNNSCVQMICAPSRAARSAARRVRFKLAPGAGEQRVCSKPSTRVAEEGRFIHYGRGGTTVGG